MFLDLIIDIKIVKLLVITSAWCFIHSFL